MKRRQFLTTAAYGVGAAWLGSNFTRRAWAIPELSKKFSAADELQTNPDLKAVFKEALEKGVALYPASDPGLDE